MINIKEIDDWLEKAQLICTKTDGKTKYNFSNFTFPAKFASKIYNKYFTLEEANDNQLELKILINNLNNNYNPKNKRKIKEKNGTLQSAKKLFHIREQIIKAFKRGIFPYIDRIKVEKESDEKLDEKSEEESEELDENKFYKNIDDESKDISYELFKKHFNFVAPAVLAKTLFKTKDKKKNNDLVNEIKSGLRDLKDQIEKMSKYEKQIENQIKY